MSIKNIFESTGLSLSEFARRAKTSRQRFTEWVKGNYVEDFLKLLCRIRKVSRMSWSKFGEILDKSYLDKDGK